MGKDIDQIIVDEIRKFDFVAQKIWPHIRFMFKNSIAPRCKQCVISSKVPYVTLANGICELCHEYNECKENKDEQEWLKKLTEHQCKELDELLKSHEGKTPGRWDALVLFSGGKDSVYMLSRLKRDYPKLRLLLTTWDNGFYSKVALDRSKQIAAKFDFDHITLKPSSTVYKTLYRYTLQNVENKGSYQTVDRMDGSLNQLLGIYFGYHLNIPLVLSGVDFAQEQIMQFHNYYVLPHEDLCSRTFVDRLERKSGFKISDIFNEEDQKLFWDGTGKDPDRIPRYVVPFVAWRPDKWESKKVLDQEGILSERDSSPILTNNQVLGVMTAIDIKTIGYCSFEPEFAEMIRFRENDATYWRNVFELVELAVRKKVLLRKIIDKVLHKLDLNYHQVGLDL